jgi:hypothetical protein
VQADLAYRAVAIWLRAPAGLVPFGALKRTVARGRDSASPRSPQNDPDASGAYGLCFGIEQRVAAGCCGGAASSADDHANHGIGGPNARRCSAPPGGEACEGALQRRSRPYRERRATGTTGS